MQPFRTPATSTLLKAGLALTLGLGWLAFNGFEAQMLALDYFSVSAKLRALRLALLGGLAAIALLLGLAFTPAGAWLLPVARRLAGTLRRLKAANLALFALLVVAFPLFVFGEYGLYISLPMPRLWMFWLFTLVGATLLWAGRPGLPAFSALLASGLLLGLVHRAAVFLPEITTYPLSLSWSEVSRYYQASLYASQRLYGLDLPLSITHPSRYMLQAIPFIIPDLPLWAHRAWQVLLWWGLTGLAAGLLVRRLKLTDRGLKLLVFAWAFVFLMQGAVFYNLLVSVVIILWGVRTDNLRRTLGVVLLASAWAGFSRINWTPVPGLLAAGLLYLEQPVGARTGIPWRYFWRSVGLFVAGMLTGLAAYAGYIALSGNENVEQFGSAFTSDLLWNRLLPSPSYPLGILTGILLVSLPLLAASVWLIRQQRGAWHWLRLLGLGAILGVLFIAGLVVSTKIGGGTNLHNMDAFMVLLMLAGTAVLFGRTTAEPGASPPQASLPAGLLALIVAVPVGLAALTGGQWPERDHALAHQTVAQMDEFAEEAVAADGEVLFISQRQLLTFDLLETDVQLIPEYEQIFLMEMAISRNEAYLHQFYTDLADHRFAIIFSDPLFRRIKSVEVDALAEENNAWVQYIIEPILCEYYIESTFSDAGVQVLKPRSQPRCDVFDASPDH